MNFQYKHLLPADFSSSSRVWIYQSSRLLTLGEALEAGEMIDEFVAGWKSHGDKVKGYGNLLFGQFVVLMADETATHVGGCSTDSSVYLIRNMENIFKVDMFNRQTLAFAIKDKVELLPMPQLSYALDNGFITPETIYFNNVVLTKEELENRWMIPVKESWLASRLKLVQ